jgi:hypothetical protein
MCTIVEIQDARRRLDASRGTAFWQTIGAQIRSDFCAKMTWLHSIGCQTVRISESHSSVSNSTDNHIVLMFGGTGPLHGFSFAFAVRDLPKEHAVSAEVWVTDGSAERPLSKVVGTVPLSGYSDAWLHECYGAAMSLLTPVPQAEYQTSLG